MATQGWRWAPLWFGLVGCGPIVIAYPPPAMLPGAIEPLGGGEIDLGVGASGLLLANTDSVAPFANPLGGPLLVGGGVGLGHGVDVSVTASQHVQGPTGGLQVGLWLLDRPMVQAGPTLGVAGSLASGDFAFQVPVVGPDGPVTDEDGEPVTTAIDRHYAYTTLAPSVGGRLVFRPVDHWSVPVAVRGSYSLAFAREGLDEWGMPRLAWIEGLAGVGWSPTDHFTLGVGTGLYVRSDMQTGLVTIPSLVVNASAHVRFDTTPGR